MKTFLIKVFSVLFAAILLSSCLGDSDNYYEISEDFAYIKYDEKEGKYAVTARMGYVKSDVVDRLDVGRAYYVSYKVSYSTTSNFLEAESFDLVRKDPVPQAKFEVGEPYANVVEHLREDSIHPTSVEIGAWSAYKEYIDDNWEIKYNILKKEDDKIDAYYYFDPSAQEEVPGVPLGENQIIVDVRFVKSEKSGNAEEEKNERLYAISSLSQIRDKFVPDYTKGESFENGTKAVEVLVKFRYIRKGDKGPEVSYIGSFNTGGSDALYYMVFSEKQS